MGEVEYIELTLLLDGLYRKYGYDFRDYSEASLLRRVKKQLGEEGLRTISQLQSLVLRDEEASRRLLLAFSINVSDMFRDPEFFLAFRKEVVPVLKTYPKLTIWHAGCAGGEEVYSMAILLKEEGLYDKSVLYATDINEEVINSAKRGIYSLDRMKEYTLNYQQAGGTESFSEYYTAEYGYAKIDESLKKRIVFSVHNLVTDGIFGAMNVIVCRNVLIYFKRELQQRVIGLFCESLQRRGILCLGTKESIDFSSYKDRFAYENKDCKIYRKKAG